MPTQSKTALHTLNKTKVDHALNIKLSEAISEGDEVILIEDGVYQCLHPFELKGHSEWNKKANKIYALADDAIARGISISTPGINFVNYEEFVQLSLQHKKVISWY